MISQPFTATHIVKPHKPKLKPKLAKECVCPNPREEFQNFSPMLKRKKLKHANTQATPTEKKKEVGI